MPFKFNPFTGKFDIVNTPASATSSGIDSETAEDIVGAMVTAGSAIQTISYNDTDGTLTFDIDETQIDHNNLLNFTISQHFLLSEISITSAQISDLTESVEDIVSGEITAGSSKVVVSYNDTDGTLSIDLDETQIDHNNLLNFTITQHFLLSEISISSSQVTGLTESVEDIVSDAVTAGSNKITFVYNDTDGSLTFDIDQTNIDHDSLLNFTTTEHFLISQISITSVQISDLTETVEDIVSGEVTAGSSKVLVTYNDTDGTLSIDLDQTQIDHDSLLNFTTTEHFLLSQISIVASQISDFTEASQDVVGAFVTVGSNKISITYSDAGNSLSFDINQSNIDHDSLLNFTTTEHFLISQISVTSSQISDVTEAVQDIVGAFVTTPSQSLINLNYTDASNALSIKADDEILGYILMMG